ncbi:MAG TPA: class I SAM-dependent methyltransferase [Planktothrix sp.]
MGTSTPSKSNLDVQAVYRNRFATTSGRRARVWRVLTSEFFQQWVSPQHSVLDFGAGYCDFINNIRAGKKMALDLNPSVIDSANRDVECVVQDLLQEWQLPSQSVDVAFSSNFLEHLPSKDGVLHCLSEAHRVLRRGGRLVLLGPNIRFCNQEYWNFFDHHLPLSDKSVEEALILSGFEPSVVIDRFLPFTMQNNAPSHPAIVSAYLRLRPAWKIFGKQFLLVATRV